MTEPKWTPGPWVYEAGVTPEMMSCVTTTRTEGSYEDIGYLTLPNHHANAHLIAAANDMYEALEKWVDLAERHMADFVMKMDANRTMDFMQGVRETRAALRKADGEPK